MLGVLSSFYRLGNGNSEGCCRLPQVSRGHFLGGWKSSEAELWCSLHKSINFLEIIELYTYKGVHFILSESYLNKVNGLVNKTARNGVRRNRWNRIGKVLAIFLNFYIGI